jgi:hypothetical protein
MNLGEFRKWTKNLPDTAIVGYHAYDEGCALGTFDKDADCWIYNRNGDIVVVMNPGEDYDDRRPNDKVKVQK